MIRFQHGWALGLCVSLVLLSAMVNPVLGIELSVEEKEAGFVPLFNGENLDGWKPMGNPKGFIVEDGSVACLAKAGQCLQTEKKYENFILRLEFKIEPKCNSGIFFHMAKYGRHSRIGGEIQIRDTYGQEPTMETAGALYNIYPPKTNAVRPAGEWNQLELACVWPRLKVTMNGKLLHDLDVTSDERLKWRNRVGPIGLQDHGGKAWFRNIRIKDLGGNSDESWTDLFNGKDFEGWHIIGDAKWKVEDGVIVADDGDGYLITDKQYKNFYLWAYVKTIGENANGGIFFRWNKLGDRGHEAQIYNVKGAKNMTGSIYNKVPAPALYGVPGQWFLMQIVCKDRHTIVLVNSKIVAEMDDTIDREGHIALQMHHRNTTILFKDIRIQPL